VSTTSTGNYLVPVCLDYSVPVIFLVELIHSLYRNGRLPTVGYVPVPAWYRTGTVLQYGDGFNPILLESESVPIHIAQAPLYGNFHDVSIRTWKHWNRTEQNKTEDVIPIFPAELASSPCMGHQVDLGLGPYCTVGYSAILSLFTFVISILIAQRTTGGLMFHEFM
jgi:hypothetical protein